MANLLSVLLCAAWTAFVAEGAGFMKWSRTQPVVTNKASTLGDTATPTRIVASASGGVAVITYVASSATEGPLTFSSPSRPTTDIVDTGTGELLLRVERKVALDVSIVITPDYTGASGVASCGALFPSSAVGLLMRWCGVLQFASRNSTALDVEIILPNGTIVPLVSRGDDDSIGGGGDFGEAPPLGLWRCSESTPCAAHSQELAAGQLGGCARSNRAFISSPPQHTSHVAISCGADFFLFRPARVAAERSSASAVALIRTIKGGVWSRDAPHFSAMYVTVGSLGAPQRSQHIVCALAIVSLNGSVSLLDSDRDDDEGPTGLRLITRVAGVKPSLPFTNGSSRGEEGAASEECAPNIEAVSRPLPSRSTSPTLQVAVYSTLLVVTCRSGEGRVFDIVPDHHDTHSPLVGSFTAPKGLVASAALKSSSGSSSSSRRPLLRTDSRLTLSQPTFVLTNGDSTNYFSSREHRYTLAVALTTVHHGDTVAPTPPPSRPPADSVAGAAPTTFALLTFVSDRGLSGGAHEVAPHLTREAIGSSIVGGAAVHGLGWVMAAKLPARVEAVVVGNASEALNSLLSAVAARLARWSATDGAAYSMVTEGLHVLTNATTGAPAVASAFSVDAASNSPRGGVLIVPRVNMDSYLSVSSHPPMLGRAEARLSREDQLTSSNTLVSTHPMAERSTCTYALRSLGVAVELSSMIVTVDAEAGARRLIGGASSQHAMTWVAVTGADVVLSPYDERYCVPNPTTRAGLHGLASFPAVDSLFVVQHRAVDDASAYSRVMSIPIGTAVASTIPHSLSPEPRLNIVALTPIGSAVTYTCADGVVSAHQGIVGNVTWTFSFAEGLPNCGGEKSVCTCPSDSRHMVVTSDRSFLLVYYTSLVSRGAKPVKAGQGVFTLFTGSGRLVNCYEPSFFVEHTLNCMWDRQVAELPTLGPFHEFTLDGQWSRSSERRGQFFYFSGAVSIVGSRCFALLGVLCDHAKHETCTLETTPANNFTRSRTKHRDPLSNAASAVDFIAAIVHNRGSWALLAETVRSTSEDLFVREARTLPRTMALGASLFCFSITNLLSSFSERTGAEFDAEPMFTATDVLDLTVIGSLWFVLQAAPFRDESVLELGLYVYSKRYDKGVLVGSAPVASYAVDDHRTLRKRAHRIRVFSLPRSQAPKVCVTAGNLTCFDATSSLGSVARAQVSKDHYGLPAVGPGGLMVFAEDDEPCHAMIYGHADSSPRVAWLRPHWRGEPSGVEMNIDVTSCRDALLSSEGLLVFCRIVSLQEGLVHIDRHMFLLRADTGEVLLSNGPSWVSGGTSFSDSGRHLTLVDTRLSTVYTVALAGEVVAAAVDLEASFCMSDATDRYTMTFSSSGKGGPHGDVAMGFVAATRTPYDLRLPAVELTANASSGLWTVFPLRAPQFHLFGNLRLGITLSLIGSAKILSHLGPVLSPSLARVSGLHFLRSHVDAISDDAYSRSIVAADSCTYCDARTCPSYAAMNAVDGKRRLYKMIPMTNSFDVFTPAAIGSGGGAGDDDDEEQEEKWVPENRTVAYPFSGDASLAVERRQREQLRSEVTLRVGIDIGFPARLAKSRRYCERFPDVSGRRWLVVEVAPNASFATISSYASKWGAAYFTQSEVFMATPVWQVSNMPALHFAFLHALESGMLLSKYPAGYLTGINFIRLDESRNESENAVLVVYWTPEGAFSAGSRQCAEMAAEAIPVCPSVMPADIGGGGGTLRYANARSVVWKGTTPRSRWGKGFVAVGHAVRLADILLHPRDAVAAEGGEDRTATAVVCGDAVGSECPALCQPTAECGSRTTSYFHHHLYATAVAPLGSVAALSRAWHAACGSINSNSSAAGRDDRLKSPKGTRNSKESDVPPAPLVSFRCTTNGKVVITAIPPYAGGGNGSAATPQEVVVYSAGVGDQDAFLGVGLACSDCVFFMLRGAIAQPFQWIAVCAVRSLVVTILSFLIIDAIRRSHRFHTRIAARHRHNTRRIRQIESRLEEHKATSSSASVMGSSAFAQREDFSDVAGVRERIVGSRPPQSLGGEKNKKNASSPLLLFPHSRRAVGDMSLSEREAERLHLEEEAARIRAYLRDDQEEAAAGRKQQWWCCSLLSLLPNPIAVYANIIVAASGVAHKGEREALSARIQDSLSIRNVSEKQLLDTLSSIILANGGAHYQTNSTRLERDDDNDDGEDANLPLLKRFAHFYQWNMCLNRQVMVREHLDERAYASSRGVPEVLQASLETVHDQLRSSYRLFKEVFGSPPSPADRVRGGAAQLIAAADSNLNADGEEEPRSPSDTLIASAAAPDESKHSLLISSLFAGMDGVVLPSSRHRRGRRVSCHGDISVDDDFSCRISLSLAAEHKPLVFEGSETPQQAAAPKSSSFSNGGCPSGNRKTSGLSVTADYEEKAAVDAIQSLRSDVDAFVELVATHPHCFEYAALPSRYIDDSLTPDTVLLTISFVQCVITLIVFVVDVVRRGRHGSDNEKQLSRFQTYECVFFLLMNSPLPSSLLVGAVARADLGGSALHSQTARSKLSNIAADPYVIFCALILCCPMVTHIIPGLVLYGWLTIPLLGVPILVEYQLRCRLTVQTRLAVGARFVSRVVILFAVSSALSLSYNLSAAYIWSAVDLVGGRLHTGSYEHGGYWEVLVRDVEARSIACFAEHLVETVSGILQLGLTSLL